MQLRFISTHLPSAKPLVLTVEQALEQADALIGKTVAVRDAIHDYPIVGIRGLAGRNDVLRFRRSGANMIMDKKCMVHIANDLPRGARDKLHKFPHGRPTTRWGGNAVEARGVIQAADGNGLIMHVDEVRMPSKGWSNWYFHREGPEPAFQAATH